MLHLRKEKHCLSFVPRPRRDSFLACYSYFVCKIWKKRLSIEEKRGSSMKNGVCWNVIRSFQRTKLLITNLIHQSQLMKFNRSPLIRQLQLMKWGRQLLIRQSQLPNLPKTAKFANCDWRTCPISLCASSLAFHPHR